MVPPLGIGIGLGSSMGGDDTAVVIEDYMWELLSAGNLAPLAAGTVSDFHDTWDLDSNDYMPQTTATVAAEGYWDLDGTNIRPLDV
jgi:hypothetical protein|tara:strand:+ start:681 stop:938 length:258 start_codon:yes stop_codon:yes gene_type:complete